VLKTADIKTKPTVATEIRDNLESWCQSNTPLYALFLQKAIPVFLKILDGPPVFNSTAPEQVGYPSFG
jgi:transformation/transcription domain-associated protein